MTPPLDPGTPRPPPSAPPRSGCSPRRRACAGCTGPRPRRTRWACTRKLRAEHGPVAPVLLHGDVPAWLVLGYRENLHMVRTPSQFTRDSRVWHGWAAGRSTPTTPAGPDDRLAAPTACSPTATNTSGCAGRSPTGSASRPAAASAGTSPLHPASWSTSSARAARPTWSAGSPSTCRCW